MTLRLPAAIRDELIAHAREGAPEEVVGALAGERGASEASTWNERAESGATRECGDDASMVEAQYRADNAAAAPRTRYEIAPDEELELLDRIDEAGLGVVGFYHSHPQGPLAPSETDARLAAWPGYSYVIVSLASEPDIGSWRWTGERFEREEIDIVIR
ncbi:MAG: proteasome lid subunit RPN8/RPN11 [Natronomonas sp.]|jgi:proteasome lid subunit RPN8/RPN11|uniref:desampylase n=1 Tax=Natronomonas sp. TaxID=2184060 RepID=UPI00398A2E88